MYDVFEFVASYDSHMIIVSYLSIWLKSRRRKAKHRTTNSVLCTQNFRQLEYLNIIKIATATETRRHYRVRTHNCNPNLWSWNPQTMSFLGYPKVIPYTKSEHFGIFHFWVMLRTNKQTNKQTELNILPTPNDSDGVGNNMCITQKVVLSGVLAQVVTFKLVKAWLNTNRLWHLSELARRHDDIAKGWRDTKAVLETT